MMILQLQWLPQMLVYLALRINKVEAEKNSSSPCGENAGTPMDNDRSGTGMVRDSEMSPGGVDELNRSLTSSS